VTPDQANAAIEAERDRWRAAADHLTDTALIWQVDTLTRGDPPIGADDLLDAAAEVLQTLARARAGDTLPSSTACRIQVDWHAPDQAFAAVFLRDGIPWYLSGLLVGMAPTRGGAVENLTERACWLIEHGHPDVTLADRAWLLAVLDTGTPRYDRFRAALAAARQTTPATGPGGTPTPERNHHHDD
jgi:hypothetical protein